MPQLDDRELLEIQLDTLKREHRELDEHIASMAADPASDQLKLKRLKIRKLSLKDMIGRIEDQLYPDIIA